MSPTGEPIDPSLIVFAALAIFVVWKLRSVLGVRVDREEAPPPSAFAPRRAPLGPAPLPGAAPDDDDAPDHRPEERWKGVAENKAAALEGLDALRAADPQFDGPGFVGGARRAYEMIVGAFARGDRDALRPLLAADVYEGFAREIARREEAGETVETAIVAIDSALVDSARIQPGLVEITVRFAVRLINIRKDRDGAVIDGGNTTPVEELWTFARNPRASDPNWKLVATRAV
jgi:predicted lipid-binding transport protein (Tim44 family)